MDDTHKQNTIIPAIFPSDNILARLCDEQKFFKQYFENFSKLIPFCELKTKISEIIGSSFIIEKASVENTTNASLNSIVKKCFAFKANEKKEVGYFVLGYFEKSKTEKAKSLIKANKFNTLSFKTFYTCEIFLNYKPFFSWTIKNKKWYKKVKKI